MLWYRPNAVGKPEKKKIISRMRGYHRITVTKASITGLPNNNKSFDLPPLIGFCTTLVPTFGAKAKTAKLKRHSQLGARKNLKIWTTPKAQIWSRRRWRLCAFSSIFGKNRSRSGKVLHPANCRRSHLWFRTNRKHIRIDHIRHQTRHSYGF